VQLENVLEVERMLLDVPAGDAIVAQARTAVGIDEVLLT
jgi:hypothetical protein